MNRSTCRGAVQPHGFLLAVDPATGVVEVAEVIIVAALNCDLAQGYLFSRAMPVPDFAAAVARAAASS